MKITRRLGIAVSAALLSVFALGSATPANALDTSWGGAGIIADHDS